MGVALCARKRLVMLEAAGCTNTVCLCAVLPCGCRYEDSTNDEPRNSDGRVVRDGRRTGEGGVIDNPFPYLKGVRLVAKASEGDLYSCGRPRLALFLVFLHLATLYHML